MNAALWGAAFRDGLGRSIPPSGHNERVASVVIKLPGGEGVIRQEDGEIELTHDVTVGPVRVYVLKERAAK